MMLRLAVTIEGSTRYHGIAEGVATLGSSHENDLVIRCSGVSRRHATVERRGRRIVLADAGSKNGLIVGGRKVTTITLESGTDVIIGRAVVRLNEVDTADAEIALLLDVLASSRGSSLGSLTETASAATDATRRLLRWVRLAEAGQRADELLEEARQIVGATTLMIVRAESVIAEIAGPLPPRDALRDLASPAWIVVDHVRAHFADATASRSWRRDFLAFVATKIASLPSVPATTREPGALVFGEGVVRGRSSAMASLYAQIEQLLPTDLNVLLLGESGSGKEVIARLIHDSDPTRTGRFIAVNMTAVTASMLEAELFGVEEGVATEVKPREGAFRAAQRGTILLDEIGDMPVELQAKLLRVVDEHAVTPVGASIAKPIDVRVIAATNADLARVRMRDDLRYRLSGIVVDIPPLRARREDIPQLAQSLATAAARRFHKPVQGFTADALRVLTDHTWPGNVRELRSVVERAVAACPRNGVIDASLLTVASGVSLPSQSLDHRVATAEAAAIQDALHAAGGNRSQAARILGISRATLHKRLREYGIE
jgi:two-component system response regulator HydG